METVALRLVSMGAEVCNAKQVSNNGNTALTFACKHTLEPVALKLLAFGKDACSATAINANGESARSLADAQPCALRRVLAAVCR